MAATKATMPRHRTTSSFCVACRLRLAVCICGSAPRLHLATRVVMVIHAVEWRRPTNTGHLTRLALANSEIRVHGLHRRPVSSDDIDSTSPSTLVLYPGRGADALTPETLAELPRPLTLLVPDGTWMQAKNMMRRVPMLGEARAVYLETPRPNLPRLRRNVLLDRRSTFEAVAQSLGVVEGRETEQRLLSFLWQFLRGKQGAWRG
jgi:DTW domain-containing protein YfiP